MANEFTPPITYHWLPVFITQPRYRVYRHLLLLLVMATFICAEQFKLPLLLTFYIKFTIYMVIVAVLYTNMYWLVPKYLFRNRFPEYLAGVVLLIAVSWWVAITSNHIVRPVTPVHQPPRPFPMMFVICLMIASSATIKLFQRWIADSQRIYELEKITMHTELEQLKNQINPHFLFNMLNNTNVLIRKDPEKASQVLMKLSAFLRYQLYDSARQKVLITSEVAFLTDLLNLENIRRERFSYNIFTKGNLTGVQVAPLLFVTFVENAVKHSATSDQASYVLLEFEVADDRLIFRCTNSKAVKKIQQGDAPGGLGLANVRRRLDLLYPSRYTLVLTNDPAVFTVFLTIEL